MMNNNIKIALDVEFKSSNLIKGDCLQLGFVAFLENPIENIDENDDWIVGKLSVCFKTQNQESEKNVMNFWANFPEMYQRIQNEAVPVEEGMCKVQQWLNEIYIKYNVTGFIADPASVDFQWFRSLYLTHCDQSLNTFNLPYKALCTDSMLYVFVNVLGLNKAEIISKCSSPKYPHTHYALEDALECAYFYLRIMQYKK